MTTGGEIRMRFPGGRRVVAEVGGRAIETDQPVEAGGEGSAPQPFELFLASIGACAGFFALVFLQKRGLPTEGLEVVAHARLADGNLAAVDIDVTVPPGFPDKYRDALIRAVDQCSVKRAIQAQPTFDVRVSPPMARAEPAPAPAPAAVPVA